MLVLSRKLGQRVQVGPDVQITIVKIDKASVRIGIEAPGNVTVYREEIFALEQPAVDTPPLRPAPRISAHAA